jgi:hypothetical protein
MYTDHHVSIYKSTPLSTPTFVYHAWQETHVPNEVPEEYTSSAIDFPLRRTYEGPPLLCELFLRIAFLN